jgi:hypothetical protein
MDINKIISIIKTIKEDGAIGGAPTNSVGDGGLTSKGQKLAGYDKVIGDGKMQKRSEIIGKGKFPGARTRWKKPQP